MPNKKTGYRNGTVCRLPDEKLKRAEKPVPTTSRRLREAALSGLGLRKGKEVRLSGEEGARTVQRVDKDYYVILGPPLGADGENIKVAPERLKLV